MTLNREILAKEEIERKKVKPKSKYSKIDKKNMPKEVKKR